MPEQAAVLPLVPKVNVKMKQRQIPQLAKGKTPSRSRSLSSGHNYESYYQHFRLYTPRESKAPKWKGERVM